jgi:hypothetical protein
MSNKFKVTLTHKAIGFIQEEIYESHHAASYAIAVIVGGLSEFNMDGLNIEVNKAEEE